MTIPQNTKLQITPAGKFFYRGADLTGVEVTPEQAKAHIGETEYDNLLRSIQGMQRQSGVGVAATPSTFTPTAPKGAPGKLSTDDVLAKGQAAMAHARALLGTANEIQADRAAQQTALGAAHAGMRESAAALVGGAAPLRERLGLSAQTAAEPAPAAQPARATRAEPSIEGAANEDRVPLATERNASRAVMHVIEVPEGRSIADLKDQTAATKWLRGMKSKLLHARMRPNEFMNYSAALIAPEGADGLGRKLTAEIYARTLFDNGVISEPCVYVVDLRRVIANGLDLHKDVLAKAQGKGLILLENADVLDSENHFRELEIIEALAVGQGEPVLMVSGSAKLRATLDADYHTKDTLRTQLVYEPLTPNTLAEIFVSYCENQGYKVDDTGKAAALGRLRSMHNAGGDDIKMLFEESRDRLAEHLYPDGEEPKVPHSDEKLVTLTAQEVTRPNLFDAEGNLPVLKRLEAARTGQEGFKSWARSFANRILENQRSRDLGEEVEPSNTNILMFGEKGTGKTSAVDFINDVLFESGERNGKRTYVTAGELIGATDAESFERVVELFKRGKGGLIVIDEAHILAKSPQGQAVIRALVPFALNESGTTTLALLGYPGPLMDCLDPQIDEGTDRRFPEANRITLEVPERPLLKEALEKGIEKRKYKPGAGVIDFAMSMVDKAKTKAGFGNYGAIRDMIDAAVTRLSNRKRTPDAMRIMVDADFGPPPQTLEGVLSCLDKYVGFGKLREQLLKVGATVEEQRQANKPVRNGYQPYARIVGEIGTGRKSFATELTGIYENFDLVSDPNPSIIDILTLKGDVVGAAVTLTNQAVRRVATAGGHMVLHNLGALVKNGDQYATDVASTLKAALTKERSKIAVSLVGTDAEIEAFFKLEPALRPLFSRKFELDVLDGAAAAQVVEKKVAALDFALHDEAKKLLPEIMAHVVEQPKWQNGLDIESLVYRVQDEHLSVRRKPKYKDWELTTISSEALIKAVDDFLEDKGGVAWSKRNEQPADAAEAAPGAKQKKAR